MKTLPSGARLRAPGVIALLITVVAALAISVGAASAATAATKSHGLSVTALDVTPKSVKPGLGQATVTMTWTITDTAALAATVDGDLYIRMQGSTPGTYLGMAYDIPFTVASTAYNGATWVSGTAAQSSYSYVFAVPVYANDTKARWVVSEIDAHDDLGNTLAAADSALAGFSRTITTTAQIDSTAPALSSVYLVGYNPPAYIYDAQHPAVVSYQIEASDTQSGFWKGILRLAGPNGQSLTADFAYLDASPPNTQCPAYYYQDQGPAHYASCSVSVTFPAGSVGTWTLASVTLTDNAGNTATYPSPNPLPVGLSNDSTLRASGFSVSPNPLNTWGQAQTTQLTFSADGVQQGLTSVVVNAGFDCYQQGQTPTQNPDGTYSVPITMEPSYYGGSSCQITGLVLTDGAGDLALYGSDYSAPDPGLTISRVADTTAPTVTAASLTSSTISAANYAYLSVLAIVSAPIAPVESYSATVYDANGNPTNVQGSGYLGFVFDGGTADLSFYVPQSSLAPGTYTVAFTITDAGGLSTSYGGPGQSPVPGGSLTLTVTP